MVEREADVAPRHGQALHDIEAGAIFGPWRAQELAPGGHLVEQAFDPNSRAGWKRRRTFALWSTMIDDDLPTVLAGNPAFDGNPSDACDRRQRFAAKAE